MLSVAIVFTLLFKFIYVMSHDIARICQYPFLPPTYQNSAYLNSENISFALSRALGPVISEEKGLWDSKYTFASLWYNYQLYKYNNHQQVYEESKCDIVVIPMDFFNMNSIGFYNDTLTLFPLIYKIPHILVLRAKPCDISLFHPNAKLFHYITNSGFFCEKQKPKINITISPYLWRTHFNHSDYSGKDSINAQQIISQKKYLLTGCWKTRSYGPRVSWMNACKSESSKCNWIDWDNKVRWETGSKIADVNTDKNIELARKTIETMSESWYTMLPTGDFCTRSSMIDVIMTRSISVVPEICQSYYPFIDIINYEPFIQFVNESNNQNIVNTIQRIFNISNAVQGILYLERIKHIFQYSFKPKFEMIRFSDLSKVSSQDDALTFTFKRVIYDLCKNNRLRVCMK